MRIRVTTRADLFEERKQQHIERGYGIEDERPIPVNGFCSFVAVNSANWLPRHSMEITVHVLIIEGIRMSLKIRFRFDARCILPSL